MKFVSHSSLLWKRLLGVWREPLFRVITIWGHAWILMGSWIFYHAEYGINPKVGGFLDCLYWAMQTVTTVGYGDVPPVTAVGKTVSIFMMAFGSLFLWTYASLLVSVILSSRFEAVEQEIGEDEALLRKISSKVDYISTEIESLKKK